MDENKRLALRQGVMVFIGLAVLTGIEFIVGRLGVTSAPLVVVMVLLALLKAGLVVWFYMHLKHLFQAIKGGDE